MIGPRFFFLSQLVL